MTDLKAAISWSGSDVTLSLFVLWRTGEVGEVLPCLTVSPRVVRRYELEDAGGVLSGKAASEIDVVFDVLPAELDSVVWAWLDASVRSGAVVAWFGVEGSFDFEHILTVDVADQIYGVAVPDFIALATDDQFRLSAGWLDRLAFARQALG